MQSKLCSGGEGESEDDEDDEPTAELKKPNSDEVRAGGNGAGGWLDWTRGRLADL